MPPALVCVVSWLVPGAGHLMLGRRQKAIVFFCVLVAMFAIGLFFNGQLAPFSTSDPLVFGAAVANLAMGVPYFIAVALDLGKGVVTAASYEYGYTMLIVAGLLNMLVVLDAFDVSMGRK